MSTSKPSRTRSPRSTARARGSSARWPTPTPRDSNPLDSGALKRAVAELNDDLGAARRHWVQLESWRADQEAESSRVRQLWDLAEVAHERLASMTVEEKRTVLGLLDVRVHVQGYDPLRIHIEGFVKDGLSLDAAREPAQVAPQELEPCPPDQKDSDAVRCAK